MFEKRFIPFLPFKVLFFCIFIPSLPLFIPSSDQWNPSLASKVSIIPPIFLPDPNYKIELGRAKKILWQNNSFSFSEISYYPVLRLCHFLSQSMGTHNRKDLIFHRNVRNLTFGILLSLELKALRFKKFKILKA